MIDQVDEPLVLQLELSDDVDLNKATEVVLKMAKQRMDDNFHRNQIKPGDAGYQYDKQVRIMGEHAFGCPQEPGQAGCWF